MNYRLIVLNLFLVTLLVIGGINLRNLASAYESAHQPRLVIAMPETAPKLAAAAAQTQPAPEDWTDIPTKNLFSFDRTDVTLVAPAPPPPPNLGPKPVLFGTLSLGTDRVAMVAPGQGGNRSFRPMHVGESIDGWTIVEIEDKTITVKGSNTQATIILNDPTSQVSRDYTRTSGSGAPPQPAMAPAPPAPANQAGTTSTGAKKTKVIQTPFGPKVVDDPPLND